MVSIACVFGGGQSVYTALMNRKPTVVGITEVAAKKPEASWLRVENGTLDVLNAAYTSAFGVADAKSIFVPLVPRDVDSADGTIHLLVETSDPALVALTNRMREFEKKVDTKDSAMRFLAENASKLRVERPVEGLVTFGIESGKEERKIKELFSNLAPDAVILVEGEKPDAVFGAVMLVIGLVVGYFSFRGLLMPKSVNPPHLNQAASGDR